MNLRCVSSSVKHVTALPSCASPYSNISLPVSRSHSLITYTHITQIPYYAGRCNSHERFQHTSTRWHGCVFFLVCWLIGFSADRSKIYDFRENFVNINKGKDNKKTALSQRWPHNAPHISVLWKFSGLPDNAHNYSSNFLWAFVLIDHVNMLTKFEVRSFTCSWDNRGTQKFWVVPGYAHAPSSPKFLMGFSLDASYECTCQIWSPYHQL